jgi:thiol-disulfide isomerase/thioredoxin
MLHAQYVNPKGLNSIDQGPAVIDVHHFMPKMEESTYSIFNRINKDQFLPLPFTGDMAADKYITSAKDLLASKLVTRSIPINEWQHSMSSELFKHILIGTNKQDGLRTNKALKAPHTDVLPSFVVTDARGKTFRDQDLNKGIFLIDFWGTWCSPCIASMPKMVKMAKKFEGRVQLISYAMEINSNEVSFEAAEKKYGITWKSFYENRNQPTGIADSFELSGFPTYILVKDGIVLKRSLGAGGIPQIESLIERLLNKEN